MQIAIRKAKESEIGILWSFEQGIVEAERPFDHLLKGGEVHYYDLMALIRSDRAEVLVAVVDGEVVGSGFAKIVPAKHYHAFDEYAYLGFMYVKPAFRGQGINKQIVQGLAEWARSMQVTEIRLEVYDENTIAKHAYLKAGFSPALLEMRMDISQ